MNFLSSLFRRAKLEHELDEEVQNHLRDRAADLEQSGLTREAAHRQARIEFGAQQRFKEEMRDAATTPWLATLGKDLRFGLRMFTKSPAFTAVAVTTLALGIGANTAIFSVVYAALLRPLPYEKPDQLITLGEARGAQDPADPNQLQYWNASYPDFLDWRRDARAFQSIAGFNSDGFTVRGLGEAESIPAMMATTNFFSTLGVKPFLGRDFATGEDVPSGPNVVILTYGFWQSRFNGDKDAVGKSLRLGSTTAAIIGVLPREFEFAPAGNAQFWVPLHIGQVMTTRRNLRWINTIGRLAPGATQADVVSEMRVITVRLAAEYPQQNAAIRIIVVPLRDRIVGSIQPLLLLLFGAVGFVLLIACANVASLLMARATSRRREFAIRAALGAGRGRLISQLLAESVLLSATGAALGFLIARWGTTLMISGIPKQLLATMPFLQNAGPNPIVMAFLCACAILTGLAFGIVPAFEASRSHAGSALKEESRSSSGTLRTRFRDTLVIVEIAVSLVLLMGAGLMMKSLAALMDRDPGFNIRNLLTFGVFLPPPAYPQPADIQRFDDEFRSRVGALPGVTGVSTSTLVPLTGSGNTNRFIIEGQPTAVGQDHESNSRTVSIGYFSMMGVPLIAGRAFTENDETPTAPVRMIVNQAWVKRFLNGESPLGKRVRFTNSPTQPFREIVGVTGDYAEAGLDSPGEPTMFSASPQSVGNFMNYVVRTSGDPASMIATLRGAMRDLDSQLVMIRPTTIDQVIAQSSSVFLRRYPSYMIGAFAALALLLAMVGLYGLVSYSVSQRTREVGIRLALGAQRNDVMRLILEHGVRLTIAGVIVGTLGAFGLTRLMRSLLYGVSPMDPAILIVVATILIAVSGIACFIPARRAIRTDPAITLRSE
jgi:putative ABC transport system permease protein